VSQGAGLDLSKVKGRKFVIVADTDGHGISLAAAYIMALSRIVPEDYIALVQHFDVKGPATAARGNIPALISMLADHVDPDAVVIMLDVPVDERRVQEHFEALRKLAQRVRRIRIVDHLTHSKVYAHLAPILSRYPELQKVEFILKSTTPDTFVEPLLFCPTPEMFDLATLGTIMDMDMASIRSGVLDTLAEIVRTAGAEKEVYAPSIDAIRRSYNAIVALDTLLKFGRDKIQVPDTKIAVIGNMAPVTVWLLKTGVGNALRKALELYKVPKPEEVVKDVEVVEDIVAVYKKIAPKGQGFKYAALIDAAVATPVTLVVTEGFQPDKKILIVVPDSFTERSAEARRFTVAIKNELFKLLKEKGISGDEDQPRGAEAFAIGIRSDRVDEAINLATDYIVKKWVKEHYIERIVQEELTVLVADKALATSTARLVERSVHSSLEEVKQAVARLEEMLENLATRLPARPTREGKREEEELQAA